MTFSTTTTPMTFSTTTTPMTFSTTATTTFNFLLQLSTKQNERGAKKRATATATATSSAATTAQSSAATTATAVTTASTAMSAAPLRRLRSVKKPTKMKLEPKFSMKPSPWPRRNQTFFVTSSS